MKTQRILNHEIVYFRSGSFNFLLSKSVLNETFSGGLLSHTLSRRVNVLVCVNAYAKQKTVCQCKCIAVFVFFTFMYICSESKNFKRFVLQSVCHFVEIKIKKPFESIEYFIFIDKSEMKLNCS